MRLAQGWAGGARRSGGHVGDLARVDLVDDPGVQQLLTERQAPTLIDAGQAAAMLGVPESWVRQEARRGRLPHIKFGRYVRFEPEALVAWWKARERGPRLAARGRGA